MRRIFSTLLLVLILLICTQCPINNPVPTLSSITPASKVSHLPTFTLTAVGTDFVNGAAIVFNGNEKSTAFINSTEITCEINPDEIVIVATVPVLVRNPTPGGGDSNSLNFTIESNFNFSGPINISNNTGNSLDPTIGVDGSGEAYAAWFDDTPGNFEILFCRTDNLTNWSLPSNVSNNPGYSQRPTIAVDTSGNLNLVWEDDTPGNFDIFFCRSVDGGSTWSAAVNVSNNAKDSIWPHAVLDTSGNPNLIWTGYVSRYQEIFFSRSTNSGSTWSTPRDISNYSGHSMQSTIGVDSSGSLNVAWENSMPAPQKTEILFSRSTDNGSTWSLPTNISNNSGSSYFPSLAVDGPGNLNLVWIDGTPGYEGLVFTRSTDSGSTWSLPSNIYNIKHHLFCLAIVIDSAGNLNLVWSDNRSGEHDIYFIRSIDNGTTWSPVMNISNNNGISTNPAITVDKAGDIYIVWWDNTPGNNEILYSHSQ